MGGRERGARSGGSGKSSFSDISSELGGEEDFSRGGRSGVSRKSSGEGENFRILTGENSVNTLESDSANTLSLLKNLQVLLPLTP